MTELDRLREALQLATQSLKDGDCLGASLALIEVEKGIDAITAVQAALASAKAAPAAMRTTGYVAPKGRYVPPVLFNPYSGQPRDARDIHSDPQGILIAPPGALILASPPVEPVEARGDAP